VLTSGFVAGGFSTIYVFVDSFNKKISMLLTAA